MEENTVVYYCVVLETPVCTVQYTSVLEEVEIVTVQVLESCCSCLLRGAVGNLVLATAWGRKIAQ